MTPDTIPLWLAIPATLTLSVIALYRCYILPGYLKDRSENSEQN